MIELLVTAEPKNGVEFSFFNVRQDGIVVGHGVRQGDNKYTATAKVELGGGPPTFEFLMYGVGGAELEITIKRKDNNCVVYSVKKPGFIIPGKKSSARRELSETNLPINLELCL